ncbi:MAG TPA: cytochrome P450 [Mycobacterium sp.]|nr:cytochrome P450 [Mycobacterium sp.]
MSVAGAIVDPAEFFGEAAIQDPYPLYARLRAEGGVHRVGDSGFYLVSSWAAVSEAATRPADFSSNLTGPITYSPQRGVAPLPMDGLGGPTHILATADDPPHAVHRKLMVGQFTAKRVRGLESLIVETFEKLWGAASSGPPSSVTAVEWMDAVANRLPMMIVARLIGVPDDDSDQLARWGYASTQLLDGLLSEEQVNASMAALGELNGYIVERLAAANDEPGDDLIGVLATACKAGQLERFTAQMILISLFSAGGESTASLLGTAVDILAADAGLQRRLREDPTLLGSFVEETLRLEPSFRAHHRHVVVDTALAGTTLPRDSRLLLLWGAANRDPAQFTDPDTFRLDRPVTKGHMTFGKGLHFCLGAPLARLEAVTVLRLLLARTTWFEAAEVGPWLPSVLARRREYLRLVVD